MGCPWIPSFDELGARVIQLLCAGDRVPSKAALGTCPVQPLTLPPAPHFLLLTVPQGLLQMWITELLAPTLATVQAPDTHFCPSKSCPESGTSAGRSHFPSFGELIAVFRCTGVFIWTHKISLHPSKNGEVQCYVGSSTPSQASFWQRFYTDSWLKWRRNGPFLCRITFYCLITCAIYELNSRSLALECGQI